MAMKFTPRVTYGSAVVIDFTMPTTWWGYRTKKQGGSAVFSSGVPEAYTIRTDYQMKFTLRFDECELLAVQQWILDAQDGNAFTWEFDPTDPTTTFVCYLDGPTFEDGFEPVRSTEYPKAFELDVIIRSTVETPMFVSIDDGCLNTGTVASAWVLTDIDAGGGRFKLAIVAPFGAGTSQEDASLPSPIGDALLHESAGDVSIEWITDPLPAGTISQFFSAVLGMLGTNTEVWDRMDATMTISHLRGGVPIASYESDTRAGGFLGGGSYEDFPLAGMGPLSIEAGDQILLTVKTFAQLDPMEADDGFRISFGWGNVPGPLTTTRLYLSTNIT